MKIIFFNMLFEMGTLGLLHVVTYLERNGYPAKHVYLTKTEDESEEEIKSILAFIDQEQPDLIGFSLMTFNFFRTKRLTLEIKTRFPNIPVLWGGIHPTFNPEESIKYADYVCVGEGEDSVMALVKTLEGGHIKKDIPNIWMKQDDQVIKNGLRSLIQNLDDYPAPQINWDNTYCLDDGKIKLLTHNLYQKYVYYKGTMYDIMISRGCPYTCSYCANGLFKKIYAGKGKFLRYRSVDNAIAELKAAKKTFPYLNMVNIQDDGFAAADEEYLKEFAYKYKREIGLPLRLRIIPTAINENKMKYLAEANTLVAVVGLQANDRVNKELFNRNTTAEQFLKVARLIKKYNIVGQYDLIIKNPFANEQDEVEVCKILAKIPKPFKLEIFALALFPNTPLRERAIKAGIKVNELDGYVTTYGNYPERFPHLRSIQMVSQYTPKFLMDLFISTRNSIWGRSLFKVYFHLIYQLIHKFRASILKSTKLVRLTKMLIFFPQKVLGKRAVVAEI
ncbi:MAG: Radical domain protein [Candidatus Brocadiaceae bacterium]|nr:Radical domain protein [Candidatus Brocadiaceae bacterium]